LIHLNITYIGDNVIETVLEVYSINKEGSFPFKKIAGCRVLKMSCYSWM